MEQKATQNYSNDCEPVLINPIAASGVVRRFQIGPG
jgi:hypothetical protein